MGNVGGAGGGNHARLRMIPINTTGIFTCGQGPNSFRLVEAIVAVGGVQYVANNTAGSCTIEVSSVGSTYEGTFSGTFVNTGGESIAVTSGQFRNSAP
jgi:hypothetical protein